ncbi:hypothetical protein HPB52_022850 [Rhipicephalus sanguineus]|uniref:Uncharacterized protein n=1 Tax=Rhipicephalus sanguineus TaxID=34632 RepID=A0A9D4TBZ6_RHISA|nr:hypothetical protein HPB52_022850 [Rhipicephalus sanguineus]
MDPAGSSTLLPVLKPEKTPDLAVLLWLRSNMSTYHHFGPTVPGQGALLSTANHQPTEHILASGVLLTFGRSRRLSGCYSLAAPEPSLRHVEGSYHFPASLGNGHPDERHKVSMELHRKYGPIFVEKLPGRYSVVHLSRAADIKNLYQEEGKEPVRIGATPFKRYRESRPQYYSDAGLLNL